MKNYMTELAVAETTFLNADWDAPVRHAFYAGYVSAISNLAYNDKNLTESELDEIQMKVEKLRNIIK